MSISLAVSLPATNAETSSELQYTRPGKPRIALSSLSIVDRKVDKAMPGDGNRLQVYKWSSGPVANRLPTSSPAEIYLYVQVWSPILVTENPCCR